MGPWEALLFALAFLGASIGFGATLIILTIAAVDWWVGRR